MHVCWKGLPCAVRWKEDSFAVMDTWVQLSASPLGKSALCATLASLQNGDSETHFLGLVRIGVKCVLGASKCSVMAAAGTEAERCQWSHFIGRKLRLQEDGEMNGGAGSAGPV